jgi:ribonuclease J
MVRLAPGRAAIIDEVPSGRLYVDGGKLTGSDDEPLKERRHAATNGVVMVAVAIDGKGRLTSDIEVRSIGLPGDDEEPLEELLDRLAEAAEDALKRLDADSRNDDERVEQAVGRALKKLSQRLWSRRPVIETLVVRV